jgi:hypothetical protein
VIPNDASNIKLLMQEEIMLRMIQAILISFADFEYSWHRSKTYILGEPTDAETSRLAF